MKTGLYIFYSRTYSGAEIVTKRLICHNKSIKPIILCTPGNFSNSLKEYNFKIYETQFLEPVKYYNNKVIKLICYPLALVYRTLGLSLKVFFLLKREKVDFIHANNLFPSLYILPLLYIKFLLPVKVVRSHFDASFHNINEIIGKYIWRILIKRFDINFAASDYTKKVMLNVKKSDRIFTLYSGLESLKIQKHFNQSSSNSKSINLGIIGQIIPSKGHNLLLKALENLNQYDFNLHIIGKKEGKYYESLLSQLEISPIKSKISFSGFFSNMNEMYENIDLVVNATSAAYAEPLGTTIIEGMAFGKIVVASNVGGTPEIINHNIDGFLYKPDNIESLTNILKYTFDNFNKMNYIRENAIEKVKSKFQIETMVERYNYLLEHKL
ncbi:MAG: glycosyltransferase family 4 protein [Spirosomataceae bacterium]